MLSAPQTQHPYAYALNNPTRYTDPSGEFVSLWGGAFTGAAIGALIGGVSGGVNYALQHGQPLSCMLRDPGFWNAILLGMATGAVSGFIAGFFAPLHLLSSGFWTTVQISGLIGGISALYSQITTNALTGQPLTEGWGLATLIGAITGGVMGGIGYGLQQWHRNNRPLYSGPAGGYPNQKPSDLNARLGLEKRMLLQDLLSAGDYKTPSFLIGAGPELRNTAKYIYVIDDMGHIWTARAGLHHPDLVGGANVYGAGELYISTAGEIVMISDSSGHYLPVANDFFQYMEYLLGGLGIKEAPFVCCIP